MAERNKILNSQLEAHQPDIELQASITASANPNPTNFISSNPQKRKQIEDLSQTESKMKRCSSEEQNKNESVKVRLLTWNIDGLE